MPFSIKIILILLTSTVIFSACDFIKKISPLKTNSSFSSIIDATVDEFSYPAEEGEYLLESFKKRASFNTLSSNQTDKDKKWTPYLNGIKPEEDPTKIKLKKGDLVEWRYE